MSRTDKDRPYWVKRNDPTLLRYIDHDHLHFGEERYINVPVRDENNEVIMEEVTKTRRTFRYYAAAKNNVSESEAYFGNINGKYDYLWAEEEYSALVPKTKRILAYKVADHCTENEPVASNSVELGVKVIAPCDPWLLIDKSYSNVNKARRQEFHNMERRSSRDHLTKYVKEVNTYGYDEDFNDDDTPFLPNRPRAWWRW